MARRQAWLHRGHQGRNLRKAVSGETGFGTEISIIYYLLSNINLGGYEPRPYNADVYFNALHEVTFIGASSDPRTLRSKKPLDKQAACEYNIGVKGVPR